MQPDGPCRRSILTLSTTAGLRLFDRLPPSTVDSAIQRTVSSFFFLSAGDGGGGLDRDLLDRGKSQYHRTGFIRHDNAAALFWILTAFTHLHLGSFLCR